MTDLKLEGAVLSQDTDVVPWPLYGGKDYSANQKDCS